MAKVAEGIAVLAGGIALALIAPELLVTDAVYGFLSWAAASSIAIGASLTLGGIAGLLQTGPGSPFSIRQSAAPRVTIYGQVRVAGTIVYISTSNGGEALNQVIVWAAHECQSIQNIYLDGRQVHLNGSNQGDGNTYTDPSGNTYSFGSTDIQACQSTRGNPGPVFFSSLHAVDSNWQTTMLLNGLCATYIRTGYDANRFVSAPGVKATIYGNDNIFDPRSNTYGYTNNWALVIADFLCNSEWGVGCVYANEIDQDQLISAANICDEQVALAAGGYESRYTINGSFATDSTPGEILDAMLQCAEGRISYTGGMWAIFPAAWYGSALSFGAANLVDKIQWTPTRKYRDLVNAVRPTYICPFYPFAQIGYDQDHKNSGVFSGQWQPTDAPEYAQDPLHGYSSDANLAMDGNVKLYSTRSYRFTTSCAMAQRLAKIYLLRNRFQGSGTLKMSMSAYQLTAQDNFQITFDPFGWANQYLEVEYCQLVPKSDDTGQSPPTLTVVLQVNQTDPSVFYWSDVEERTPDNSNSPAFLDPYTVQPPSGLTLISGQAQAVINADGIITPRIQITWTSPSDPFVASGGHIEVQWQIYGSSAWISLGRFAPSINTTFLTGLVSGQEYNVQVRAARGNGATSAWVEAGPEVASATGSLVAYAWGTNAVGNAGFETNVIGNALGADNWYLEEDTPGNAFTASIENDGNSRSGVKNLLIRTVPNGFSGAGSLWSVRVFSAYVPVSGSTPYYYSGWITWGANIGIPSGIIILGRIGLYFWDANKTFIQEAYQQLNNQQNVAWTQLSGTVTTPSNAVYALMQCAAFVQNTTGSGISLGSGLIADLRFDDLFFTQQTGSSLLGSQGSIMPSGSLVISYTFTSNSATFTWAAQTVPLANGQSITTNSGSVTYSGLSSSTTYYTYWYVNTATGAITAANGNPPGTTPSQSQAMTANLDGSLSGTAISFTTLAGGSGGSGGGGGGVICPEAAELVDVTGKGIIAAGSVAIGDYVRGFSFKTNSDCARKVIGLRRESCGAWRSVAGHVVSPCEPVYVSGAWIPAYQASSDVVAKVGTKVLIEVQADDFGEHNYWLMGETPLLIHNYAVRPCGA